MKNWKIIKLGELLTESKIESINPNTQKRIRVKLNVGGIEKRPDLNEKDGATKYFIRKAGQFIYGRQNLHKGAFGIIPNELDGFESSSDIPAFDVHDSCYPEWIFYFFKQGNFYLKLETLAKGVGSKRINPSQLFNLNIALPSKDEQRDILNLIYELEQKILTLSKESEFQVSIINRLKKTVLEEALEGKLTEAWRNDLLEKVPIKNLTNDILFEKARLMSEKKIPKETFITSIEKKDFPYLLPENWAWVRLVNIINSIDSGKSPQCENRPAEPDEWGVLKTTAVQSLEFLGHENKALPSNISPNKQNEVNVGDILITRAGPKNRVGIVCAVSNTRTKLLLSDKIVRLKTSSRFIYPEYLSIALSAGASMSFLDSKKSGMAESQVNISQNNIKLTPVPIMPYNEQVEIVNKVKTTLEVYSDLESNVLKNKDSFNLFVQSYLKKIFGMNLNDISKFEIITTAYKKNSPHIPTNINKIYSNSVMELEELLKQHNRLSAIDLWKMSKYKDNIDLFYAALKLQIEENKTIKESSEKGFLELAS